MSTNEQATRLLMRYPLYAWDDEWLADYETRFKALSPANEGDRASRGWWLDYIAEEIDRRKPNPWQ
jgi:hypothetical protein